MSKTIEISREMAENLLHCGDTASTITPYVTAQLRALLAAPVVERQEPVAAKPISDEMMDLVDRLGSEACEVDPRAWEHILVYAPIARRQEPVKLQHMAVAEFGQLRWMTGRQMVSCELYAMPDGSAIREPLYTSPPAPVAMADLASHLESVMAMFAPGEDKTNRTLVAARACLDKVKELNQ